MMGLRITILLFVVACFDYKLTSTEDSELPPSSRLEEDQKWIDGYPEENICSTVGPSEVQVEITEGCDREPQTGTLDAVIEWSKNTFQGYGEYNQTVMAPVVGQLNDDNQDGQIDTSDTPDIVIISDDEGFIDNPHGVLRILSGSDGEEQGVFHRGDLDNAQIYPYRYSNAALGDIDADGQPEIVFIAEVLINAGPGGPGEAPDPQPTSEPSDTAEGPTDNPIRPPPPNARDNHPTDGNPPCAVAVINTALEVEWYSDYLPSLCAGHAPAIADLEGDGEVEVIVGSTVIRGRTGEILFTGEGDIGRFEAYVEIGAHSIVSDINMDGFQEIIAGRSVYNAFGQEICRGTEGEDGFTATADLDEDGYGEFIVVSNQQATMFDTDCSLMRKWPLVGGGTGGPPTIADYDGDLRPEIGLVDANYYTVYDTDGTIIWSNPVSDLSSHATGSVVFDFEGDGFPEVVYGDEYILWIFDGRDGTVRYQNEAHTSRTLHEYPTVADLDGDGSAEIIVVNGGAHQNDVQTGLFVLGSESNSWQRGRQVWNQHAYHIVNVNEDLSIPENPASNWPLYNNFRSGDVNPIAGSSGADATPLGHVCLLECYLDQVVLGVQVANQGPAGLRAGIEVHLYAEINAQEVLLSSAIVPAIIDPGGVSEQILFRFNEEDIPEGKVWLVVDEGNFVNECVETNNRTMLEDIVCP